MRVLCYSDILCCHERNASRPGGGHDLLSLCCVSSSCFSRSLPGSRNWWVTFNPNYFPAVQWLWIDCTVEGPDVRPRNETRMQKCDSSGLRCVCKEGRSSEVWRTAVGEAVSRASCSPCWDPIGKRSGTNGLRNQPGSRAGHKTMADCPMQCLTWMCLQSWKLDYPTFSYKWTLSLFGGSSLGVQLPYTFEQWMVHLYQGRSSSSIKHTALEGMHMEQWERKKTSPYPPRSAKSPLVISEVTDVVARSPSHLLRRSRISFSVVLWKIKITTKTSLKSPEKCCYLTWRTCES